MKELTTKEKLKVVKYALKLHLDYMEGAKELDAKYYLAYGMCHCIIESHNRFYGTIIAFIDDSKLACALIGDSKLACALIPEFKAMKPSSKKMDSYWWSIKSVNSTIRERKFKELIKTLKEKI